MSDPDWKRAFDEYVASDLVSPAIRGVMHADFFQKLFEAGYLYGTRDTVIHMTIPLDTPEVSE